MNATGTPRHARNCANTYNNIVKLIMPMLGWFRPPCAQNLSDCSPLEIADPRNRRDAAFGGYASHNRTLEHAARPSERTQGKIPKGVARVCVLLAFRAGLLGCGMARPCWRQASPETVFSALSRLISTTCTNADAPTYLPNAICRWSCKLTPCGAFGVGPLLVTQSCVR